MKVSKNVNSVKAWGLKCDGEIWAVRMTKDPLYLMKHDDDEIVPVEIRQLKQLKRTK